MALEVLKMIIVPIGSESNRYLERERLSNARRNLTCQSETGPGTMYLDTPDTDIQTYGNPHLVQGRIQVVSEAHHQNRSGNRAVITRSLRHIPIASSKYRREVSAYPGRLKIAVPVDGEYSRAASGTLVDEPRNL